MKKCEVCKDPFKWDDTVIVIDDSLYHKDCITLYPIGYYAMVDDEPIGETENEDGQKAFEIIDDEYLIDDEEE